MAEFQTRDAPPQAVTDYLDKKGLKPSFDWDAVWQQEHATAFTVAKLTELSVLNDVHESLKRALANGTGFKAWSKEVRKLLEEKGWAGPREVTDPETGEVRRTNLTSPHRLRTIFNTNMRTARAAGQYERASRTASALPYFLYRLGASREHRPHHEEKDGLILPVGDPFWREWFPPNGWGCKCWLRQISEREAQRLGYDGAPAPRILEQAYRRKSTGEIERVPQGIDPGFAWSPGQGRASNLMSFLGRELGASPMARADAALADLKRWPSFRKFVDGAYAKGDARREAGLEARQPPPDDRPELAWERTAFPVARLPDDLAARLGLKLPLVVVNESAIGHGGTSSIRPADAWGQIHEGLKRSEIYRVGDELRVFWKTGDQNTVLILKRVGDDLTRASTLFTTSARRFERRKRDASKAGERLK